MVLENTLWLNIKRQTVYRVLFVCKHSETLEDFVCYQDVDNPEKRWVRPYNLFIEKFKPIENNA
jgi:hypothetical protein